MQNKKADYISLDDSQEKAVICRDHFKAFLRQEKFSENAAERIIAALSFVDFYISMIVTPKHRTVFEVSDVKDLISFQTSLMNDFSFMRKDREKGNQLGYALLEYIEFAKTLDPEHQVDAEVGITNDASSPKVHSHLTPDSTEKLKQKKLDKRQILLRKATEILQPIEDYLIEYKLYSIISFEYKGLFQDVDILKPVFERDLLTEEREIAQLISLMMKFNVPIPNRITSLRASLQRKKQLRDTIRDFENWLVGYVAYLRVDPLAIDSIYFSPGTGFNISFAAEDSSIITIVEKAAKK